VCCVVFVVFELLLGPEGSKGNVGDGNVTCGEWVNLGHKNGRFTPSSGCKATALYG
jgi:hypothetical protein